MDNLNDRIKSMFDMFVGSSISSNMRQLLQMEQPQPKSATNSLASRSQISLCSRSRVRINSRSKTKNRLSEKSTKSYRFKDIKNSASNNCSKTTNNSLLFASGLNVHLADRSSTNRRYDCSVFFIHCVQHHKVALTKPSKHQAVWMPFMPMPHNQSWNEGGLAGLLIVLSNGDMDTFVALKNKTPFVDRWIIEVASIQLPQTMELINRITWMVKLDTTGVNNFKCCQDNDSLIWVDEHKLNTGTLDYMWGPELIDFYRLHINNDQANLVSIKFSSGGGNGGKKSSFIEYNLDSAFQFLPRNPPRTDEEAMLLSSNLSEKDIERLYSDFLDHCFPSMSMAFHSFRIYMTKYGFQFEDERLTHLFFAFNYNSNGSITFPELLMGLACIDCHSTHNEVRAKFVMRYYDVHKRNYLTCDDIRQMLVAIHPKLTKEGINNKLKETIRAMEPNMVDPNKITYKAFVGAVGSHQFRGTSKLCRADRPVFQMISNIIFTRRKRRDGKELKWSAVVEGSYSGTCSNCKEKRSVLDEHILRIDKNGYVCHRQKLRTTRRDSVSTHKHLIKSLSLASFPKLSSTHHYSHPNNEHDEAINISWNLVKIIREFAPNKGDTKRPNGFMSASNKDRQQFYEWLTAIEKCLAMHFESEARCVSVNSPAFLIGDIHGNLDDLLTLEQCLWKQYPAIDANLVFLGDYVDRGKWSIECVVYLFALKILMPYKVTMLRGNHEVRPLQAHYSYKSECITKYGEEFGEKIWELTNRLFDRLPLCAIIDEAIFCAHGGIPRNTIEVNEIQRLDNYIAEPEHGYPIAWEILWSDPIHQQQFLELACLLNDIEDPREGFLPNRKRGTAFVFNEDAATKFLKHNGLTHIIRAHEVPTNGFFFHFDKKCATIFSSSHYCGNNNECAVVLVEGDTIRIIRIDTSNNKSATD